MRKNPLLAALLALAFFVFSGRALAGCTLGKIADLPATMVGLRPVINARINDVDVPLIADSGAFYSMVTSAAASQLKLRLEPAPFYLHVQGVGGEASISLAVVKTFTFSGIPIPHVEFLVGGSEPGSGALGALGQNILGLGDVEYDLSNGIIRLIHAENCRGTPLAYWDKTQSFSVVDIDPADLNSRLSALTPVAVGAAYVNGKKVRVLFDTGAATSIISPQAAARAGVKVDGPGVVRIGFASGVGRKSVETWVAPFEDVKIGDEEIKNTKLRIADLV